MNDCDANEDEEASSNDSDSDKTDENKETLPEDSIKR